MYIHIDINVYIFIITYIWRNRGLPAAAVVPVDALTQVYGRGFRVSAVEQTRNTQESQGHIPALAFRQISLV